MDRLANIIQQVNDGKLTDRDAIKQLEYFMRSEESNQYKSEKKYLIQEHTRFTGDPLEIITDRETLDETYKLVCSLLSLLTPHYRHIFYLYVVENYNMRQIGDKFGISKQAVHTYLKRIRNKFKEHSTEEHRQLLYKHGKEVFTKHISIGYPYEIASRKFVDARFTRRGEYKTRYSCGIKEYLDKAFGDDKTVCNLCAKMCGQKEKAPSKS